MPSRSPSTPRTGRTQRKKPDRETLRTLYLEDKIGIKNIGLIYGVHKSLVTKWLQEEEIPRFGMSASARLRIERSYQINGLDLQIKTSIDEPYCLEYLDLVELEKQGRIHRKW